jgi:hypothetical protein
MIVFTILDTNRFACLEYRNVFGNAVRNVGDELGEVKRGIGVVSYAKE